MPYCARLGLGTARRTVTKLISWATESRHQAASREADVHERLPRVDGHLRYFNRFISFLMTALPQTFAGFAPSALQMNAEMALVSASMLKTPSL